MTKEQLKKMTLIYIENNVNFEKAIERLINSGAIDTEAIKQDDYTIVKAIASVVLTDAANYLKPTTKEGLKEVENLQSI